MSRIEWRGDQFLRQLEEGLRRNLGDAAGRLVEAIQEELSHSGGSRHGAKTRKASRGAAGVHSSPGQPPLMQSGRLRASIGWGLVGPRRLTARVGSGLVYAKVLETTLNRPFLRTTLRKKQAALAAILARRII